MSQNQNVMLTSEEPINRAIKDHEITAEEWCYHEIAELLYKWADRFSQEFKLGIETPAIKIDQIRGHAVGCYRNGRNGFGLRHEITFNTLYLDFPLAEHLDTLLHELLHEWQNIYGKPGKRNYHNKEFREKAKYYGLIIDEKGNSLGVEPGLFTELLEKHGVDTQALPLPKEQPIKRRRRGTSKMKKWSCGCTNVRCASILQATCKRPECGGVFQEAPPSW